MIYYTLFTEGLDAIARNYIRQQADDPTAHDRWQAELKQLCDFYSGHLQDWAARPAPKPAEDEMCPDRLPAVRLAADDLTLEEFTGLCKWHEGHAGLYPAMQAAANGRADWLAVFAQYCLTVKQRQAAFTKFAKLAQAVLDADPTTLPDRDIAFAARGWLDRQALVLPYSTSWEKARREASDIMGYTDRVQL